MLLATKIIMWLFIIFLFVPALIARIARGKVNCNTYQWLCDIAEKSAVWSCRIFFGLCGIFALYIFGVGLYHIIK
jgi:hypothetical protein